jgi:hypothetical protein
MNADAVIRDAVALELKQEVAADTWSLELVDVCKACLADAPHWRADMQALLRTIAAGEMRTARRLIERE